MLRSSIASPRRSRKEPPNERENCVHSAYYLLRAIIRIETCEGAKAAPEQKARECASDVRGICSKWLLIARRTLARARVRRADTWTKGKKEPPCLLAVHHLRVLTCAITKRGSPRRTKSARSKTRPTDVVLAPVHRVRRCRPRLLLLPLLSVIPRSITGRMIPALHMHARIHAHAYSCVLHEQDLVAREELNDAERGTRGTHDVSAGKQPRGMPMRGGYVLVNKRKCRNVIS